MFLPNFSFSPTLTLAGMAAGIALLALSPQSRAADDAAARTKSPLTSLPAQDFDNDANYKEINLGELVAKAQKDSVPGQRIIFAPTPVKFRATLGALPVSQKADYLQGALGMMKISNPPKVSQRIGLDYGGEKLLSAYIEEGTASRLSKEVKPGQVRTFYGYHVYNYSRGPALLVTSFSD